MPLQGLAQRLADLQVNGVAPLFEVDPAGIPHTFLGDEVRLEGSEARQSTNGRVQGRGTDLSVGMDQDRDLRASKDPLDTRQLLPKPAFIVPGAVGRGNLVLRLSK